MVTPPPPSPSQELAEEQGNQGSKPGASRGQWPGRRWPHAGVQSSKAPGFGETLTLAVGLAQRSVALGDFPLYFPVGSGGTPSSASGLGSATTKEPVISGQVTSPS